MTTFGRLKPQAETVRTLKVFLSRDYAVQVGSSSSPESSLHALVARFPKETIDGASRYHLDSAVKPRGLYVTLLRFKAFTKALIRHWNFSGRIF
jgi:hypothetical protein